MFEQFVNQKSFIIIFLCAFLIVLNVENLQNLRTRAFTSADYKVAKKWKSESPKQIYFCKTHKTGGSTLQNIIFRYAMKKNLTIGLPESGVVLCEGSVGFHAGCTDTQEGAYDVIANHNNWSPYVDEALPYASKITVIRHPLSKGCKSANLTAVIQAKKNIVQNHVIR